MDPDVPEERDCTGEFSDPIPDSMSPGPWSQETREDAPSSLKIFLIADIRGYTRFTHERGDEAAAKLAAKFAVITREIVGDLSGELLELRGDEALVVFDSSRQALRAALALQRRFVSETRWAPDLPLAVGIGLDVGEAIRVESGYRGGALNLAARLCSAAGAGEVLVSREVVHLAGHTEDMRFTERSNLKAKGLPKPLVAVQVRPAGEDPAQELKALQAVRPSTPPPRVGRSRLVVGVVAATCLVVVAVLVTLVRSSGSPVPIAPDSLARFSLTSGTAQSDVPFSSSPGHVAVVGSQLWVSNTDSDTITVYDIKTRGIQTIAVGHQPGGLAAAGGAVWVANAYDGTVSRINVASRVVVQTVLVGAFPDEVAADTQGVWVTNTTDDTVTRIDPASGAVTATVRVGQAPSGIVIGHGFVWVANAADGTVSQIDPATNNVIATIIVGQEPTSLCVTADAVWVANTLAGTVSRIDPLSGSVSSTIGVGGGPRAIVAVGNRIWVGDSYSGVLTEVSNGRVVRHVTLGDSPDDLAVAGGSFWVSVQPAAAVHRGGTLRLVGYIPITTLDPASPYGLYVSELTSFTNDALVAFNRVGGAAGSLLVPDLAASVPAPTNGGRTYTFRLRSGLRYSTGAPVRASDVRSSLERMGREQTNTYIPGPIVGGAACSPKACDLSRGIVTDDETGTVTFHLTAPDSDFLYQLALAVIVPVGTPVPDVVVPSTGPYVVKGGLGSAIEFVRNPYFHEWSHAAQPDGFPDTIQVSTRISPHEQVLMLESGKADWSMDLSAFNNPPAQRDIADLRLRYPDLFHAYVTPGTKGIFFNVRVPPFNNLEARQAVNFAIDRLAVRKLTHAAGFAECQILPPDFPGYRPYCPYTVSPGPNGRWLGPDPSRADHLIEKSGTRGDSVTFIAHKGDEAPAGYIVNLLDRLGYRAELKMLPTESWVTYVADYRNRPQAGLFGWGADYPSAADFLVTLFSCQSFNSNPQMNFNVSEFCDPVVQRDLDAATTAQSENPQAASQLWAAADRAVVDRAVWAPIYDVASYDVVSARVHNYENSYGIILDQLWLH